VLADKLAIAAEARAKGPQPKKPLGLSAGGEPLSTLTSKPSLAARAPPCRDAMNGDERRILRLHVED
jgi:hypothetical protein